MKYNNLVQFGVQVFSVVYSKNIFGGGGGGVRIISSYMQKDIQGNAINDKCGKQLFFRMPKTAPTHGRSSVVSSSRTIWDFRESRMVPWFSENLYVRALVVFPKYTPEKSNFLNSWWILYTLIRMEVGPF